ncbi:hypothetical protein ACFL52_00190 [Candidatus Margulisiibacteriota bacterium]
MTGKIIDISKFLTKKISGLVHKQECQIHPFEKYFITKCKNSAVELSGRTLKELTDLVAFSQDVSLVSSAVRELGEMRDKRAWGILNERRKALAQSIAELRTLIRRFKVEEWHKIKGLATWEAANIPLDIHLAIAMEKIRPLLARLRFFLNLRRIPKVPKHAFYCLCLIQY